MRRAGNIRFAGIKTNATTHFHAISPFNCFNGGDGFREFVLSQSFNSVYDLDEQTKEKVRTDDIEAMKFAFRFLRQALYGERTIPVKPDALAERARRKQELNARLKAPIPSDD